MAYEEKKYDSDEHFDYAFRERDRKKIHITEVPPEEKGKKGYRCLGTNCGNQLVAVPVRKNPKYKPYFRHAAINFKKGEKACSFSNRKYREALASSILTRLRSIKVPPIYKVNPQNSDEHKLIEESKFVDADSVQSEVTFYEDKEGVIQYGKNPQIDKKYIVRRPDVVFFNKDKKPILFIELVVTNKLDDDKIADLYRLGIDTIQIQIPKTSEEDIEKCFQTIKNTKWVYNEKESKTNYLQIPRKDSQRILESDELENRLFKESYNCRVFRVKDTIRGIGICLESESFAKSKLYFDSEISRVTHNTESENQRLGDLEESNRRDALARNSIEEDYEDKKNSGLEKRYSKKDRELRDAIRIKGSTQKDRRRLIVFIDFEKAEIERIEQEEIDFEAEIRERVQNQFSDPITRERKEIDNLEKTIRTSINRELASTNSTIKLLGVSNNDIPARTERDFSFPRELEEGEIIRITGEIEQLDEEERILEDKISNDFKGKIQFEESEITRIRKEEGNIEESAGKEFDREIKNNARGLSKEFTNLLEVQGVGYDYKDAQRKEYSYKRAQEFFRKGTWQKG
jgi:hypothetical protein